MDEHIRRVARDHGFGSAEHLTALRRAGIIDESIIRLLSAVGYQPAISLVGDLSSPKIIGGRLPTDIIREHVLPSGLDEILFVHLRYRFARLALDSLTTQGINLTTFRQDMQLIYSILDAWLKNEPFPTDYEYLIDQFVIRYAHTFGREDSEEARYLAEQEYARDLQVGEPRLPLQVSLLCYTGMFNPGNFAELTTQTQIQTFFFVRAINTLTRAYESMLHLVGAHRNQELEQFNYLRQVDSFLVDQTFQEFAEFFLYQSRQFSPSVHYVAGHMPPSEEEELNLQVHGFESVCNFVIEATLEHIRTRHTYRQNPFTYGT